MKTFVIKTEIETFNDEDKFDLMCLKLKQKGWNLESKKYLGIKGFNYTCIAILTKEISLI